MDGAISLAVELLADDVDGGEFVVGDFDAGGVGVRIELATDFQRGLGGGRAKQLDDRGVADQGFAVPVAGDDGGRRCSMRLSLLVPGGKLHEVIGTPRSSASFCNWSFADSPARSARFTWSLK